MTPPTTAYALVPAAPAEASPTGPVGMLEHAHRAMMLQRNQGTSYHRYASANALSLSKLVIAVGAYRALEPFGGLSSEYAALQPAILHQGSLLDTDALKRQYFDWALKEDPSQDTAKRASRMLRGGRPVEEVLVKREKRRPGRQKGEGFPKEAHLARSLSTRQKTSDAVAGTPIASNVMFWAAAAETSAKLQSINAIALTFMARAMAYEELIGDTLSPRERDNLEARVRELHRDLIEQEKRDYDGVLS